MKLTFRCFDGGCHSTEVDPNLKIGELKHTVQRLTGIHKLSQRLVFAGSTLADADSLSATSLADGCTIFVLVNKAFPTTLGPFETVPVPFRANDFELPPLGPDFDDAGTMWIMDMRPLVREGVRSRGAEFPLVGQFSPPHPVTLTAAEKEAIGIPAAAASFVFSYPVAAWNAIEGGSAAARSFLAIGGYVYLSRDKRILHATTLLPSELGVGGLQFLPPKTFEAEWTTALHQQGRFQRLTIKGLNDMGAHHFCWLRPGEVVKDAAGKPCASQPSVPHGGFAYLFHTNALSAGPEERQLDRYFACASGDDYFAMTDEERHAAAAGGCTSTFGLVSDLQTLQDLQDRAALQAASLQNVSTGATSGEQTDEQHTLQTEITRLELALDQATKCVCCADSDKNTILNCGHYCLCSDCATRIQQCPLCRQPITERRRAFP